VKKIQIIVLLIGTSLFAQGGKDYGQFAPDDAYIDSSGFAYYGAENEWTRRMFSEKATGRFYKRRGQRQMIEIIEGRIDEAIGLAKRRLADDRKDPESLYILTVAYARQGKAKLAYKYMRKALKAGLPFSRFVAGPRELLEPLINSTRFKKYYANHPISIVHGPLLGAVSATGANIWLRTATASEIEVTLRHHTDSQAPVSAIIRTDAAGNYAGVAKIEGLLPDSQYSYSIKVDGREIAPEYEQLFATYPEPGVASDFKLGFGGGAGYTPQNEYMWSTISHRNLDAMLLLGDNVYIDMPTLPGAFHDYTYYRLQSRPEFRALISHTPIFTIWDDHDSGIDDVWMGPFKDRPVWKMPLLEHFKSNWANPDAGSAEYPGCWYKFTISEVDFFMLDGRTWRTNPFAPTTTMLGPVQKAWLLDALKTSNATFKVVISPVPWAPNAKPNSKDTWDGHSAEREEIFSAIRDNRIEGVILLSADRHRSDAWKIDVEGSYPLYEFCSSKLTNTHTHDNMQGTIFSYNEKCSFGEISFNMIEDEKSLTYRTINIDNEVIDVFTLARAQLVFE
jgi:alkaline phosphatase D|tara:strand:+ start:15248 stop:16936 length:1689 start_codon:yes stop_codon:yes gene_type:complete